MTINYARESVIDFTKPFMNLGISILFKVSIVDADSQFASKCWTKLICQVPTSKASTFFSFLSPLGFDTWLFVGGAIFMACFTLFTLARFTPYEWTVPIVRSQRNKKYLTNSFTVSNSFWFIVGTLLRQPSGINPQVDNWKLFPTKLETSLISLLLADVCFYIKGANHSANAFIFIHESPGCGYLGLFTFGLRLSVNNDVRRSSIFTARMA